MSDLEVEVRIRHPQLDREAVHISTIDSLFIEAVGLQKVTRDAADVAVSFVEQHLKGTVK